mmetsp:Transcript_44001/g.121758  ORF Transcript_44001/g.121758 Transcript_44001/m.121758 type:complete len:314 (-) Transcript_44001:127-1068(-)|eukprot:CAMPEP_0117542848 /NCGR_PEP_ID=MMETSP0784-20121206/44757_1 /TAXON_ID=39447 /ORGANISM="" /LENGTH=313 /DNA_ID=CAMNT_0005339609 /DNA_START=16 /DNA_END=957 /DNA_ORIENTATION=-
MLRELCTPPEDAILAYFGTRHRGHPAHESVVEGPRAPTESGMLAQPQARIRGHRGRRFHVAMVDIAARHDADGAAVANLAKQLCVSARDALQLHLQIRKHGHSLPTALMAALPMPGGMSMPAGVPKPGAAGGAALGGAATGAAAYLACKGMFCKHPSGKNILERGADDVRGAAEGAASVLSGTKAETTKYGYEEGNVKVRDDRYMVGLINFRTCEANCKLDALLAAAAGAAAGGMAAQKLGNMVDEWSACLFFVGLRHGLGQNRGSSAKPWPLHRVPGQHRAELLEFLGLDIETPGYAPLQTSIRTPSSFLEG